MRGNREVTAARSPERPTGRGVLAGLAAALLLIVPAGTAAAAPVDNGGSGNGGNGGGSGSGNGGNNTNTNTNNSGNSTPLLDCVIPATGGAHTAVLGYSNSQSQTTLTGSSNTISPSQYDGAQPTTFESGTHHGVFTIDIDPGDSATWFLGNTQLVINGTAAGACPSSTELPADGNGTGVVVALLGAGVVGALAVRRTVRRRSGDVPAAASVSAAGPDRVDA